VAKKLLPGEAWAVVSARAKTLNVETIWTLYADRKDADRYVNLLPHKAIRVVRVRIEEVRDDQA
jgi:hypothetical protein